MCEEYLNSENSEENKDKVFNSTGDSKITSGEKFIEVISVAEQGFSYDTAEEFRNK